MTAHRSLLLGLALLLAPGLSWAQDESAEAASDGPVGFDSERFRPATTSLGGVMVQGVGIGAPWELELGTWIQGARRPVVLTLDGERGEAVVAGRFGADMILGWNIGKHVRVALDLPVTLYQWGTDPVTGEPIPLGGLGDLKVVPQVMILDPEKAWLGVGLSVPVGFPTGRAEALLGEQGATIHPRLALEKRLRSKVKPLVDFAITLNAGWDFRPRTVVLDLNSAGEFTFGVGARWEPGDIVRVGTEVVGAIGSGPNARYGEWALWAALSPFKSRKIDLAAGFSVGLGRGVGSPEARGFIGVRGRIDPRGRRSVAEEETGWPEDVAFAASDMDPQPPIPGETDSAGWGLRLVGRVARIDSRVLFDLDSHRLRTDGQLVLAEVADWLIAHPGAGLVEIGGHCDLRGSAAYNRSLSQKRAEAVRDFLVINGVRSERLLARGYGESRPLRRPGQGSSEEVHAANRRVEFRFFESGHAPEVHSKVSGSDSTASR